jgi:hypothetical protein
MVNQGVVLYIFAPSQVSRYAMLDPLSFRRQVGCQSISAINEGCVTVGRARVDENDLGLILVATMGAQVVKYHSVLVMGIVIPLDELGWTKMILVATMGTPIVTYATKCHPVGVMWINGSIDTSSRRLRGAITGRRDQRLTFVGEGRDILRMTTYAKVVSVRTERCAGVDRIRR